jgi:hypothetical protein
MLHGSKNIITCMGVRVTNVMVLDPMIGFIDPSLYSLS